MKNRIAFRMVIIQLLLSLLLVGCQKDKVDNGAELEKLSKEIRASLDGEIVFARSTSIYKGSASGGSSIFYANGTALNGLKWSPDGSKVAFTDGSNGWFLVICNNVGVLVYKWGLGSPFNGFRGITWSPDGNTIAALSNIGNAISYVEVATGKTITTELVLRPGFFYTSIAWSPEGNKIAISESRSYYGNSDANKYIWMLEPFKNDPQSDSNNLLVKNNDPMLLSIDYMDWSMDGSKLVYSGPDYFSHLYFVNSDGTGNHEIILSGSELYKKISGNAPCWMSNNTQIIYAGVAGVYGSTLIPGLFVTDINGSFNVDLNIQGNVPDCY